MSQQSARYRWLALHLCQTTNHSLRFHVIILVGQNHSFLSAPPTVPPFFPASDSALVHSRSWSACRNGRCAAALESGASCGVNGLLTHQTQEIHQQTLAKTRDFISQNHWKRTVYQKHRTQSAKKEEKYDKTTRNESSVGLWSLVALLPATGCPSDDLTKCTLGKVGLSKWGVHN